MEKTDKKRPVLKKRKSKEPENRPVSKKIPKSWEEHLDESIIVNTGIGPGDYKNIPAGADIDAASS